MTTSITEIPVLTMPLAASLWWLGVIYAVCFGLGLAYTVLAAVLGSIGGGDHEGVGDFGHDLDVDHDIDLAADHGDVAFGHHGDIVGGAHLGPFSPLIIALFLTCFGGAGMLFTKVVPWGFWSLPPAFFSSFVFAGTAIWAFNRLFARIEGCSQARDVDLIGRTANVITPIPAGGVGTVAYLVNGTRYTCAARSEDATPLERGAEVVVIRTRGGGCFVVPAGDKRIAKLIKQQSA